MTTEFDLALARDFGTALLLGALIGIEREKHNEREGFGIAGLRSFILLAQIGAISGYLGNAIAVPWLLAGTLVATGATLTAGYVAALRTNPERIGVTTELAAIVTVLLGALATTGHREIAIGLGIATAALLAYKQPLHGMVGRLAWDDVLVGLRLLTAAFIVLPLLPDHAIDPWNAINLYQLWLLVLLISSMSLVGYLATRWLGSGHGIAITAASGALVSSTAVTLTLVKQSREPGAAPRQLAGGILLAWAVMFLRVPVAAAIVNPAMCAPMLAPFGALLLTCAIGAAWCLWTRRRAGRADTGAIGGVPLKNPFSLVAAGKFALLFALVQLLLGIGKEHLPGSGIYLIAALAGLTDVDAVTLSMAEHAQKGGDAVPVAVLAILIAAASNTLVKAGMAIGFGRNLARPIVVGTAASFAVGAAALWLA